MYDPDSEEDACDLQDWQLPLAFNESRHREAITASAIPAQTWRMKERMKTVSVALVLCLNIGVDPPDVVKTQPCARLECWLDPLQMPPQKALEGIGAALQKQYERWQSRARYKSSLDPTVEEVKKLCTSLRRNSKEDRVLFHYNGHGVPKPTVNGEIWVFNRSYTQYIPLSIYDLQQWMGAPSIYVYDCSCAGLIVDSFRQFAVQHEREYEMSLGGNKNQPSGPSPPCYKNCIQLAACGPSQILPMNPDLPADLFTACLTTPIQIALRWFVLQNSKRLIPGVTMELIDKIPGQLHDRRTMLGELNWIFTAITDTIAWNVLPKELFQKLFRQDLLVASLFRNFLLAERIMRTYNCNPVSSPRLPPTYQHPMWQAWDLALDICLAQLPATQEGAQFQHSPFFAEQLTAFQVWLTFGSEKTSPPEQLPIVLQVLLSQIHRLRALDLLGRFLDLGPWAVNLALSVGIFPYILKLLQSCARELRPLLVFIWAKILAVDMSCQVDLVRDNGHRYFLNVLSDPILPAEHRTMAAFVMSCVVHNYPSGQEMALKGNIIALCTEQLNDSYPKLRQWLALCLGRTWNAYNAARWCGVRDSAHEKLYTLLEDPVPEVRTAAVYALGTFIGSTTERTDHADTIDHSIGMTLISSVLQDGSPLVRKELVVAFQWLLFVFENQFISVASKHFEEEKMKEITHSTNLLNISNDYSTPTMKKVASKDRIKLLPLPSNILSGNVIEGLPDHMVVDKMRRVNSSTSLISIGGGGGSGGGGSSLASSPGYSSIYTHVWKAVITLSNDPHPEVASMAKVLVKAFRTKAVGGNDIIKDRKSCVSYSEPSSPSGKSSFISGESPPPTNMLNSPRGFQTIPRSQQYQYSVQFTRTRKIFDKGPNVPDMVAEDSEEQPGHKKSLVKTGFVEWCSKYFMKPVIKVPADCDPESGAYQEKEWRFIRNARIRSMVHEEQRKVESGRFEEQFFYNKAGVPTCLMIHPYEPELCVAEKDSYSLWDDQGALIVNHANGNPSHTKITAMEYINAHDNTLLLIGSDDGAVRVWKNYSGDINNRELVTAFQALSDLSSVKGSGVGAGLVLEWDQQSSHLIASGDVRVIRVWDTEHERKVLDMPTGVDCCITSVSSDHQGSLLVAGCGDGTVRVYDRRLHPSDCRVMTMREHSGWVVKVHFDVQERRILSGSTTGDVRYWELGHPTSTKTVRTCQDMTAMAVHPIFDIFACGSASQLINIFNIEGEAISVIKNHDWFMGQRIGPVACLGFHPYKVCLASGSTDSVISVYTMDKRH